MVSTKYIDQYSYGILCLPLLQHLQSETKLSDGRTVSGAYYRKQLRIPSFELVQCNHCRDVANDATLYGEPLSSFPLEILCGFS